MVSLLGQTTSPMTGWQRHALAAVVAVIVLTLVVRVIWRIVRRVRQRWDIVAPLHRQRPQGSPELVAPGPAPAAAAAPFPQTAPRDAHTPAVSAAGVSLEPKPLRPAFGRVASREFLEDRPGWRGSPVANDSDYLFGAVTPSLAELLPESDDRKQLLSISLQNAGYYSAHAWHNLAAVRCLGIILPILLCLGGLVFGPEPLEPALMVGLIVLPLMGWSLPTLLVRSRARARLDEMARGLPDMLDLLNMCVSQGMTAPAALARVSEEIEPVYPALAKELKIVTEQARVGSLHQALRAFSRRVDLPEVHSFTSLMIQTEQMGTSVSEALADYSDSMRESFRQRADQKANAATFKMLFPTVLCLMPAVFMFLLGPAVIETNDFFQGSGRSILDSNTLPTDLSGFGAQSGGR